MKWLITATFAMVVPQLVLAAELTCVTRTEGDFDKDGRRDAISIWLMQGRRYNDTELWHGNGEKYEGRFIIMVEIEGKPAVASNLNRLFYPQYEEEQPMFFWCSEPWDIKLADYNRDGQLDFNLGQYASGVANEYRIFTVSPSGGVSQLPVGTGGQAFIGPKARVHSVDAIEATADGFTCSYYSRLIGTGVRNWYRWDSTKKSFLLARQEPPDRRPEQEDGHGP